MCNTSLEVRKVKHTYGSITFIRHAQNMGSFLIELGFCCFCLIENHMIGMTLFYEIYGCLSTLVQSIFKEKIFIITKILSRLWTNEFLMLISYSIKIILCFNQFTLFHKYLYYYHKITYIIITFGWNIYPNRCFKIFKYFSVIEHLGYLQWFPITNNTLINICKSNFPLFNYFI